MKKRITALLLAMLLCLAGCSEEAKTVDPIAQAYIDSAKPYVEAGDYASAILILEDGTKNVTDAALTDYLAQVKAMAATAPTETTPTDDTQPTGSTEPSATPTEAPTTAPTTVPTTAPTQPAAVDYSTYAGTWGNGELTLTSYDEEMKIYYCTGQGNGTRIADFTERFYLSQIANNTVFIPYTDSWGSTGLCVLTFMGEKLQVEIKSVNAAPGALWGFSEGVYTYQALSAEQLGFDPDNYIASWSPSSHQLWPNVDISKFQEGYLFCIYYQFEGNGVEIYEAVPINAKTITFSYDDDGWGNTGEITITFESDYIIMTSKLTSSVSEAKFHLPDGTYELPYIW